jgi:hypothetical protein
MPPKKKLSWWDEFKLYAGSLMRVSRDYANHELPPPHRKSMFPPPMVEDEFQAWIRIDEVFVGGPSGRVQEVFFEYVMARHRAGAKLGHVTASTPALEKWANEVLWDP